MGGCLGPRQRRQQVYIQMIQLIHEQVTHITFQQTQNLDIYQIIKQKLSKKGLLRKLIDNLVSHRNKIYDSLNHNYQIVLQNSKIQNKYAGLLIIDQIIDGIYQTIKSSHQKQSYSKESQDFTNLSSNNNNNNKFNQFFQQSIPQAFNDKTRKTSKINAAMQGNPLIRQIDSRFDQIYFNLIIYLLNDVPKMYLRILKSINSFSNYKKQKFHCTQIVWQVMDFIMSKKILKQLYVKQSILTYQLLLQNTKQNYKEYQKSSDLKYFIKMWINQQQKMYKQKSPQILIKTTFQDSQASTSPQSQQNLMLNLIKIISLYFNVNISSWNSQYLFDILIDIYDQQQFLIERIGQLQMVIFNFVNKNDLRVHFFRGLFISLLEYLCHKSGQRCSRVQSGLHSNPQQIKWPNSQNKNVKFHALKTLRRWVNNKHIDLNETVSFNCRLLFSAYLTNFHANDQTMNTQISKQFLKLVRQHLQSQSKQILIMTIIQSIKQQQTDPRIRTLIVSIMRQLLQDKRIFEEYKQNLDYIITIDQHYSKENQLQIIQLMGYIIKILPEVYFKENNNQYNISELLTFKHKICQFLYSCFQVLVYSSSDQIFKYRFCCSVVSFLRAVQIKKNISFIYAFYIELIKQLTTQNNTKHLPNKNYFILYLVYQVSHLLVEAVKVPHQFKNINQKISSLSVNHQTSNFLTSNKLTKSPLKTDSSLQILIQKILNQPKYNDPTLIKQQFKQDLIFNELQRKNLINQQNLQSTCKILTGYFTNSCIRSKNISTKDDNEQPGFDKIISGGLKSATGSFCRRDSVYHDSQNGSYYRQEDKNLKDVLGIING